MPRSLALKSIFFLLSLVPCAIAQEYKSGIEWPEPTIITPGEKPSDPPSDAIILFGGENMSAWEGGDSWIVQDGVVTANKRGIQTKEKFGDIQLHLEWAAPAKVKGKGQGRGNSGVFLMNRYEVQVLDSYDNTTYFDGQAAALYKQSPPMVNAMKKPGEWNTYDIIFTAPRRDEKGNVTTPAYITVIHNGAVVHNHYALQGNTSFNRPPSYQKHGDKEPISLQWHGNPVQFRNIWVREISPIEPLNTPETRGKNIQGNSTSEQAPLDDGKLEPEPRTDSRASQESAKSSPNE